MEEMVEEAASPAGSRGEASPLRVLVAGGGIAALEAVLALREQAGSGPRITVVAPNRDLHYPPMAAVEPFGLGEVEAVPLARIAPELGFELVEDRLEGVDPERRVATTAGGLELAYDALCLTVGARADQSVPGALTYTGPGWGVALRRLLDRLAAGEVERVVFAVPGVVRWSMPLYELAVLTARHARDAGSAAEILIATHEHGPVELFGARAGDGVRQLLAIEGVNLRTGAAPIAFRAGSLELEGGDALEATAVVALPRLSAPTIAGIPQGPDGFVPTDSLMRIEGMDGAWAAGDVTWFPIKQGGLAAQQADVAAAGIAALADPEVEVRPFAPVLRGALMTGWTPYYMRAAVEPGSEGEAGSTAPLWWPPSKVAGRLLAPFLANLRAPEGEPSSLEDLAPAEDELAERDEDHVDALLLTLKAAELDARGGDYAAALRWLEAAERLNLTLPEEFVRKRERWSAQRAHRAPRAG